MVEFFDAVDDFGVGVGGGVGFLLAGERDDYAGVVFAGRRKLVRHLAGCDFEASPFAPEVDAGGGFDHVRDVRAADAGSDFEEVQAIVAVCFEEFGVRDAADQAQTFNEFRVDFFQRQSVGGVARHGASGEHAALMGDVEGRSAVGVGFGEQHGAFGDDAVDVEDVAGNELFKEILGLAVAELVEPAPEVVGRLDFFHADARGLGARLEEPGAGDASHELAQVLVIEDVLEFGDEDAALAGFGAHGELIPEIADGAEADSGKPKVFAESGDVFHVEFVEGDDAIDVAGARGVAGSVDHVDEREFVGHEEHFIDDVAGPVSIAEFFDGEEENGTAKFFASAEKFLAFFVGGDAEDGDGSGHRLRSRASR